MKIITVNDVKYEVINNVRSGLDEEILAEKITDYFDTLDIQERDAVTGKPIFKTKDVMGEPKEVSNVVEQLKTLEFLYKKEQEESSGLMGDVEGGFMD